jgi:hypothetical protein
MATERLSMRHTREILRQRLTLGRSHRAIAQSLGISHGAVGTTVLRAQAAALDWVQVQALTEDALEGRLYGRREVAGRRGRPEPDCATLHAERRKPGVTLELLHLEYLEQHPDGYRYTQFCEIYRRWLGRRGLTMRQVHQGGEKLFVDYAGKKPSIIDATTGAVIEVELFVAVLGASNYTYAEATLTQQVPDWIASHQRAFAFVARRSRQSSRTPREQHRCEVHGPRAAVGAAHPGATSLGTVVRQQPVVRTYQAAFWTARHGVGSCAVPAAATGS